MQPEKDLETEGYFALRLVSHHATRPVCGLAVLVCFRCPIHDMQEGSRCDSRNMSLGRRFEQDFISEICICYDQALFGIHTGLVPAKNHFQPRLFSSQPAFPAWSVIQEITFSMREGKPFWNGRAPGKGCFQPRAYSRPELLPALYSFQPYSDHPNSTLPWLAHDTNSCKYWFIPNISSSLVLQLS